MDDTKAIAKLDILIGFFNDLSGFFEDKEDVCIKISDQDLWGLYE